MKWTKRRLAVKNKIASPRRSKKAYPLPEIKKKSFAPKFSISFLLVCILGCAIGLSLFNFLESKKFVNQLELELIQLSASDPRDLRFREAFEKSTLQSIKKPTLVAAYWVPDYAPEDLIIIDWIGNSAAPDIVWVELDDGRKISAMASKNDSGGLPSLLRWTEIPVSRYSECISYSNIKCVAVSQGDHLTSNWVILRPKKEILPFSD